MVMTGETSKVTRAIPTLKATATHVAIVFDNYRIFPYGKPNHLLYEDGLVSWRMFSQKKADFLDWSIWQRPHSITRKMGKVKDTTRRYSRAYENTSLYRGVIGI